MNSLYPWQQSIWQQWQHMRRRMPHALLLKGPRGVGKLEFALHVAQSLLCEQTGDDGMACGQCASCRWYAQDSHPDFRLIQPQALSESEESDDKETSKKKPSQQISVEQIRTLTDFANLSAHQGGFRVVVIHPAESMNSNAANALLKTLEEPAGNMMILLVSHKPQQLLPTILSRCMALPMPLPDLAQSTAWLQQNGIKQANLLLAQAGFAPLLAANLEAQEASLDARKDLLSALAKPAQIDALALAEQLQRTGPSSIVQWLQQWCYDLGSAKLAGRVRYHTDQTELIKNLSAKVAVFDLMRFQKELNIAQREALHPLNPRLLFESLFLSYRKMMQAS